MIPCVRSIPCGKLARLKGDRGIEPKNWSRRQDLNPRPAVYKTAALPLSYAGERSIVPSTDRPFNLRLPRSDAVLALLQLGVGGAVGGPDAGEELAGWVVSARAGDVELAFESERDKHAVIPRHVRISSFPKDAPGRLVSNRQGREVAGLGVVVASVVLNVYAQVAVSAGDGERTRFKGSRDLLVVDVIELGGRLLQHRRAV